MTLDRVVVSGYAHTPVKKELRGCKASARRGLVCQVLHASVSAYANFSLPKQWCFSPITPSLQEIEVRQSCREKANDVGLDHGADHEGLVLNWLVIQQLRPESLK